MSAAVIKVTTYRRYRRSTAHQSARREVAALAELFTLGCIDKWDFYCRCQLHLDKRRITVADIVKASGIARGVVLDRLSYMRALGSP
jgi:hypothetical protein